MSEPVRTVERALDVLLCFSKETPELTMTQIAERVGMHKSTVHRLLATLERKRFLERDLLTGIYRPGIQLFQLAYLTLEHNDLRQLAAPFLRKLSETHRENANLAVLEGTDVIYLDVIESPQRVKLAATSGQRLPAFCTASGKAIFAFMSEEAVQKILQRGMKQYTRNTITSMDSYFENIHRAKETGFAISDQEFEDGINAVAAPILNSSSQPVASISLAGPSFRLTRERMNEIGPAIKATANDIAAKTGLLKRY